MESGAGGALRAFTVVKSKLPHKWRRHWQSHQKAVYP